MKGDHLGELEELTLLAVLALEEGAYGILVQEVIDRETGREVTLGAVYAALERMERKGLLSSAMSASTGERGGGDGVCSPSPTKGCACCRKCGGRARRCGRRCRVPSEPHVNGLHALRRCCSGCVHTAAAARSSPAILRTVYRAGGEPRRRVTRAAGIGKTC